MAYNWLPPLIARNGNEEDQAYLDRLYDVFRRDFIAQKQVFDGLPINIKRHPEYDGLFANKHGTFRHLITEGPNENNRTIAWDRCERIGWMRAILQNSRSDDVCIWKNTRQTNGDAFILALSDFSFKLVLTERHIKAENRSFLLLWTAFPVQRQRQRDKLRREYEKYHAPPKS
ncbi:hypothetical protein [Thalassospira lucentensis]|uniref:hypothetical protein n=1 Tax=Thalassospira lucentensis TaxID=168935 RepID=UPI003AA8716D